MKRQPGQPVVIDTGVNSPYDGQTVTVVRVDGGNGDVQVVMPEGDRSWYSGGEVRDA